MLAVSLVRLTRIALFPLLPTVQYRSQSSGVIQFPSKQDLYTSARTAPKDHGHQARGTPVFNHSAGAPPACLARAPSCHHPHRDSGSWWGPPQVPEQTYQVTQGTGQLFGNFELPWRSEDITFPVHEEIQGPPLHKLLHHDIYKHKSSHSRDNIFPHPLRRAHFTGWYLTWEDTPVLVRCKRQSELFLPTPPCTAPSTLSVCSLCPPAPQVQHAVQPGLATVNVREVSEKTSGT